MLNEPQSNLMNLSDSEILRHLMAWYPNKKFYKNISAKSGKEILTVYPPTTHCPLYTHEEWNSDNYDSGSLEINFNEPFFDQFKKLQSLAPVVNFLSNLQENSEYCNDVEGMKNCYYCFDGVTCQDCYFCCRVHYSRDCVDCYAIHKCELLYDCTDMEESFNSRYSFHCKQVSDSAFLFNCHNCQYCFMSSNLRNKKYYVFNEQKTKEEYESFMKTIDWKDYKKMLELKKNFQDMIAQTAIPPSFLENCEEVTGNYTKNSQRCDRAFQSHHLQDAYNTFQCNDAKDIKHTYMCCEKVEQISQCVATGLEVQYCKNCAFVWHSSNMEYCYLCLNCQDCFGCIGLRKKRFCILNKQYTKEEYEITKAKLIEAMQRRNEYGDFFPLSLSPFLYEDSLAFDMFENQYKDVFETEYSLKENFTPIDSTQIQQCPISGQQFRFIKQELEYYKKNNIAFPRLAFPMRYKNRMELMDIGFEEKKTSQGFGTYFAHPVKKNIVGEKEYEESLN